MEKTASEVNIILIMTNNHVKLLCTTHPRYPVTFTDHALDVEVNTSIDSYCTMSWPNSSKNPFFSREPFKIIREI